MRRTSEISKNLLTGPVWNMATATAVANTQYFVTPTHARGFTATCHLIHLSFYTRYGQTRTLVTVFCRQTLVNRT